MQFNFDLSVITGRKNAELVFQKHMKHVLHVFKKGKFLLADDSDDCLKLKLSKGFFQQHADFKLALKL